jgi:hypothetical protein
LAVRVVFIKNLGPELLRLTLSQVTSLHSVEIVLVGDFNQFIITGSPCPLVSSEGEVRVALLTVLSDNFAVVELILDQEFLSILAA